MSTTDAETKAEPRANVSAENPNPAGSVPDIQTGGMPPSSYASMVGKPTGEENEDDEPPLNPNLTNSLYLRFFGYCKPFDLLPPKDMYMRVADQARMVFGQNLENVIEKRMGAERLYKIEVIDPIDKEGWTLDIHLRNKTMSIPLYFFDPPQRNNNEGNERRENFFTIPNRDANVLLTIKGAGERHLLHIPNLSFDSIFETTLKFKLIKYTTRQVEKYSRTPNGNKYCVIEKPANMLSIPTSISVIDPKTNKQRRFTVYCPGRPKKCYRCEQFHEGKCPELIAFEAATAERERMEKEKEINTKIYSDSTMRMTDPLGLRAEVCTMSGGGLGQVAQAALDDPDVDDVKNIVIVAGSNDVKNPTHQDGAEFACDIDRSIEKIAMLADKEKEKTVTVVTLEKQQQDTVEHVEKIAKFRYIGEKVKQVIGNSAIANLHCVNVKYQCDADGHPTGAGTAEILSQIDTFVGNKLIWNNEFTVAKNIYQRVEAIFRYGCNHCPLFGTEIVRNPLNNTVCEECQAVVQTTAEKGNELWTKVEAETRTEFAKRGWEPDTEEDEANEQDGEEGEGKGKRQRTASGDSDKKGEPDQFYDPAAEPHETNTDIELVEEPTEEEKKMDEDDEDL